MPNSHDHFDPAAHYQGPSKSQIKRDMLALTDLGRQLLALGKSARSKVPLDSELLAAIEACETMSMGARKRQIQYIGKLLRQRDSEPIKAALSDLQSARASLGRAAKNIETWRLRLLDDGAAALTEFCRQYQPQDVQQLRQLLRQAQQERQLERPPRYFRELYQLIKSIVNQAKPQQ